MPAAAADAWRFEWARTWPEAWSVADRWQELFESSGSRHVYHRPALARAWADTIGHAARAEPLVGIGRCGSGATILLACVVVRYVGRLATRRALEPLGGSLFGYHNPLLSGAEPSEIDWRVFWSSVRSTAGAGYDQALFRLLQPSFAAGVPGRQASEVSPVLPLEGATSLDDVLARCRSSHRIDVRRQLRRTSEKGRVTLWVARPGEAGLALDSVQRGLLPAYKAHWAVRSETNQLLGPGFEAFLQKLITAGVDEGWTHYSVLAVEERPIAWHLGFLDRDRLYWWLPAHDTSWSNYSPGKVLLAHLVEHACRVGWSSIHLLSGAQNYKMAWNPTEQRLVAIRWVAPTVRGRLLEWYDRGRAS